MTQLNFEGRVAIVTGAGQGMGREHAIMLASRGARVVVNDVNAERAAETVSIISAGQGTAVIDNHNILDSAADIVHTALTSFGGLDVVINNAGINRFGLFSEMDSDLWWRVFDTSFRGLVEVSRAAMPHLVASGSGRLINVSSNALMGAPHDTAYSAAKAAIWGFGNALIPEGRANGVQVSTILPVAWTPMTEDAFPNPAIQKVMRDKFPASAVAAFATWLAHQDTTVYGESFEIGGISAARTVMSAMPRMTVTESSPEVWAESASTLMREGTLSPLRSASDSFREQLVFLAPEMESEIPADAADLSTK